jgi:hypothetical protein
MPAAVTATTIFQTTGSFWSPIWYLAFWPVTKIVKNT